MIPPPFYPYSINPVSCIHESTAGAVNQDVYTDVALRTNTEAKPADQLLYVTNTTECTLNTV